MNPDEIQERTANVMALFASFNSELQPHSDHENTPNSNSSTGPAAVNQYGGVFNEDLPYFTLVRQISDLREQARSLKYIQSMNKLHSLQKDVSKLSGISTDLDNIAVNLKYMADSSEMLVHVLKHPRRDDAISLPHQHHEAFINIIKNCKVILECRNQDSRDVSINWMEIISVMKKMVSAIKDVAGILDSRLQEHQILQTDIVNVLEQLSKLNVD